MENIVRRIISKVRKKQDIRNPYNYLYSMYNIVSTQVYK